MRQPLHAEFFHSSQNFLVLSLDSESSKSNLISVIGIDNVLRGNALKSLINSNKLGLNYLPFCVSLHENQRVHSPAIVHGQIVILLRRINRFLRV